MLKLNEKFEPAIARYFTHEMVNSVTPERYLEIHETYDALTEFMSSVFAQHFVVEILEIEHDDKTTFTVSIEEQSEPIFSGGIPNSENTLRSAFFQFDDIHSALSLVVEFTDYLVSAME